MGIGWIFARGKEEVKLVLFVPFFGTESGKPMVVKIVEITKTAIQAMMCSHRNIILSTSFGCSDRLPKNDLSSITMLAVKNK